MVRRPIFNIFAVSALAVTAGAAVVHAESSPYQQERGAQETKHQAEFALLRKDGPDEGEGQEARQKVILELVSANTQVVKGKPYSADTSTESVQTLADGNRIVNRSVTKFYRDSQGRTRREQTFGNVDPASTSPHEVKIFIDDPVSSTAYVLDPQEKTARTMLHSGKLLAERDADAGAPHMMIKSIDEQAAAGGPPHNVTFKIMTHGEGAEGMPLLPKLEEKHEAVKEDLGKRTIEGLDCTGTQQTITIPAEEVGNERPIQIVTETWYSPAISAVVQSTTNDPRFGQTTYQLKNVLLTEPSKQLFEPPADFKIETPRQ